MLVFTGDSASSACVIFADVPMAKAKLRVNGSGLHKGVDTRKCDFLELLI